MRIVPVIALVVTCVHVNPLPAKPVGAVVVAAVLAWFTTVARTSLFAVGVKDGVANVVPAVTCTAAVVSVSAICTIGGALEPAPLPEVRERCVIAVPTDVLDPSVSSECARVVAT